MTDEELQSIGEYLAKIEAADGDLSALTYDESLDLETLVEKRLLESEANGSEGRWDFEKDPF